MSKLPFIKFYPGDWLRDTRLLSPQSKGAWIDILCLAWNEPDRGIYKRWPDMMQRELGILDRDDLDEILGELHEVATIEYSPCDDPDCTTNSGIPNAPSHFCNGEITVISRRMVKLQKDYKLNAERQRRHYNKRMSNAKSNGNLTNKTLDVRRHQRLTDNVPAARAASLGATPPLAGNGGKTAEDEEANKAWQQSTKEQWQESEKMTAEEMREIKIRNMKESGTAGDSAKASGKP